MLPPNLRVVGLTLGDSEDPSSRSGVNHSVFSRLRSRCDLVDVIDLDVRGVRKLFLAASNFSLNRRRWGNKLHQNPQAFKIRTAMAEKALANLQDKYDVVFQDGAMFLPGTRSLPTPFVSYHDSNVILATQAGLFGHGAHYRGDRLCKTIQQETEVYRQAALIFVMSDWLKQSLIKDFKISESKIKTVYAGINLDVGIDCGPKSYDGRTVLFVGKNFERKGGRVLLKAFRKVRSIIRDARLVIVGPECRIDEKGVEVRGLVRDRGLLAKAFRESSVFVLPSHFEPFGIAFCEAFAYHVPCIGTNICAMPEIIEHGKGGFLVEPHDHEALADRICEILRDGNLARQMGTYGYAKVKTTFNWDVVVDKMVRHCASLMQ